MSNDYNIKLKFWGTRGSTPAPSTTDFSTIKYGGNTACLEVRTKQNDVVIFDCGTGIIRLGDEIMRNPSRGDIYYIFLTHYHPDHIQGLPFFVPIFMPDNRLFIYGPRKQMNGTDPTPRLPLMHYTDPTMFPIQIPDGVKSEVHCLPVHEDLGFVKAGALKVFTKVPHDSNAGVIYKFTGNGRIAAFATDVELNVYNGVSGTNPEPISLNRELTEQHILSIADFLSDCEVLIMDSQYTPEEHERAKSWTHNDWKDCLEFIKRLPNLKRMFLFHYNPRHDDSKLDSIIERVKLENKGSQVEIGGAREGLEILL